MEIPETYTIFGSSDSTDVDVMYYVDEIPLVHECKNIVTRIKQSDHWKNIDKEIDPNFCVVKDGNVVDVFKGTVDEIDVGKIREGMTCDLQVGAIPGQSITGYLTLISLKEKKEDNTTVFPVEIKINPTNDVILRAGYSANAHIIIAKRDSVLSIPERVITFRNDSAFVEISAGPEKTEERYIKTGLSDAIQIELLEGLEEDQEVLEKEVKEIT